MRKSTPKSLKSLAAVAAFAAVSVVPAAFAAGPSDGVVVSAAAQRLEAEAMNAYYAEGMQLRTAGDFRGAFLAFQEAGRMGHPKAQRRLGQIFNAGDEGVRRDYLEALRWNQAARDQGEDIPTVRGRGYVLVR